MKKIFWIVGDVSGDLHASEIIKKLKGENLLHYGVGGKRMEKEGFVSLFEFEKLFVMGFLDVLKKINFFIKLEKKIKEKIEKDRPALVVLVDYPGLNLRIAEFAKKIGIKVIFYIAPQFWAWKYNRVYKLKKYTDMVAVILPFEEKILKKEKVNVEYVGNPIIEEIKFKLNKEEFAKKFFLKSSKKWISFFPGSRLGEVKRILPLIDKVIKKMRESGDFEFIVSQSRNLSYDLFSGVDAKIIKGYNYDIMKHSSAMAITSGTATLEAAYIGANFIIIYKTNLLNYIIGKKLIRTGRIGLPNILLQEEVYPELIQNNASVGNIAAQLLRITETPKTQYTKIREILGNKSASDNMSRIILEYAKK